jgi:chromosome segregation ATPase
MLQCLHQCWHGEYEKEQDRTQLPRNLQVGEGIIRQLRDIVAFIQEVQEGHNAHLDDELESMKEELEARERYFTELQHMIDSVKARINVRDDHLARLKIQMGFMESLMKAEGKRCAQIQEEVHSLQMVAERWVSVPKEQMVDDPVSMDHSCHDEDA